MSHFKSLTSLTQSDADSGTDESDDETEVLSGEDPSPIANHPEVHEEQSVH